jgi:hypothetical protein
LKKIKNARRQASLNLKHGAIHRLNPRTSTDFCRSRLAMRLTATVSRADDRVTYRRAFKSRDWLDKPLGFFLEHADESHEANSKAEPVA